MPISPLVLEIGLLILKVYSLHESLPLAFRSQLPHDMIMSSKVFVPTGGAGELGTPFMGR